MYIQCPAMSNLITQHTVKLVHNTVTRTPYNMMQWSTGTKLESILAVSYVHHTSRS